MVLNTGLHEFPKQNEKKRQVSFHRKTNSGLKLPTLPALDARAGRLSGAARRQGFLQDWTCRSAKQALRDEAGFTSLNTCRRLPAGEGFIQMMLGLPRNAEYARGLENRYTARVAGDFHGIWQVIQAVLHVPIHMAFFQAMRCVRGYGFCRHKQSL
jgi:hypothetical protein